MIKQNLIFMQRSEHFQNSQHPQNSIKPATIELCVQMTARENNREIRLCPMLDKEHIPNFVHHHLIYKWFDPFR